MEEFLKLGRPRQYKKGESIARANDANPNLYIIISGFVKTFTTTDNGDEDIHIIYGKGEVFPFTGLLDKRPLSLNFTAITDCEVISLTHEEAMKIINTNPNGTRSLLFQIIKQFLAYAARVDNLGYKFARERLAYRLLLLARRFGNRRGEVIMIPRFSQQEIAASINVTRENVSRELKRFETLELISYEPTQIIILDEAGLRRQITAKDKRLFIDDL